MSETSARLALPLIQPGQAQKELYHNEALALLDIAVQPSVQSLGLGRPPADPALGACWIVGSDPSGEWAGQADAVAGWTSGGWRFLNPIEGMVVWSVADGVFAQWHGETWILGAIDVNVVKIEGQQVLGPQSAAIADPVNGSTIDAEVRTAVNGILAALRSHGLIAA